MAVSLQRRIRQMLFLTAVAALLACLISCVSPDVVAKFAADASKSLSQGTAIFDDLPASVVRRDCDANVEKRDFDFKSADEACLINPDEQANLSSAKKDRDDIVAVQKVLIDYFDAIQQLATFGKATDSSGKSKDDAAAGSSAANKLKSGGKLTSNDEVKAVTSLGQIMVKAFSAGYRNRELSRDITEADDAVAAITKALTHIVKEDYMFDPNRPKLPSLLNLEAHALTEQYKGADGSPTLLRISWTDRSGRLLARNSSASSYVEALEKIRSGHKQLESQKNQLNAQSLAAELLPYISSLESLIPQIQKVF